MGMLNHWVEEEEEEEKRKERRQRRIDEYYEDCALFGFHPEDFDEDGNPIW